MTTYDPSEVLRGARREAGLTQDELAVLAGTSQSAIAAYETGAREPSWSVLERIVRASGHLLALELPADRPGNVVSTAEVPSQERCGPPGQPSAVSS